MTEFSDEKENKKCSWMTMNIRGDSYENPLINFPYLVFIFLDLDPHPDPDRYGHFWDPGSGSARKLMRIRNTA